MSKAEILEDSNFIVVRFAQLKFDLTGDLSGNRIVDTKDDNPTRFSEFCLDDQNFFDKKKGYKYDISLDSWKNYFYNIPHWSNNKTKQI